jgi:diguanylate cyclase (GGDEF)-like protein
MQSNAQPRALSWRQSLQFKLGLALGLITLVLAGLAYWAGDELVRGNLVDDRYAYDSESALRLAEKLNADTRDVQGLASTIALLALQSSGPTRATAMASVQSLIEHSRADNLIVSAGVWPLPKTLDPQAERASQFWLRDASGAFRARNDYNDPAAISYLQESWFTPAQYLPADTCFWTPAHREALSKQEVVSCTMALRDGRGFVGAVTVDLSTIRLNELFARYSQGGKGYSLLIGRDNRLLGISDAAALAFGAQPPTNLVELAQKLPAFNPLALFMHQQNEAFISAAVQSPLYNAATVSALKDASREMSRTEAEASLAAIWNNMSNRQPQAVVSQQLQFDSDAVLGEPSFANIIDLPGTHWRLARVVSTRDGLAGVDYLFSRTLMIIGIGLALAIALIYAGVNWLVLRPLRRMTGELAHAESAEDALHLQFNENADNEIGVLSHWHNERVRQLRELMERTIATNSQLVVESDERRTAQEALVKAQERATLALQAVADGVIMTNERAIVEEVNPMAEQLSGLGHRAARGRSFADVFRARSSDPESGQSTPLANLAELAISRGTRLEYTSGVFLQRDTLPDAEVYVSVTPIRTRLNRVIGAIVVFREISGAISTGGGGDKPQQEQQTRDVVTGLPNRVACDRALRLLIDSQRVNPKPSVVLSLDVDHLKRINDIAGQQAGDEVLARLGESLASKVGNAGEVFRMGADQFVVLLTNFEPERARIFAEALRELVANTRIYWESQPLSVTVSIGMTPITDDMQSPIDVLARAEDACAAAKRAGRNAVKPYDASLDRAETSVDDAIWVRRIRAGLEQSLFHLTTQWIMPAQAHQSEGHVYEILLALEDEEGFWASHGAFMPVAERHHLVAEMDRWVLRSTLDHLSRYPETLERLSFCAIQLSGSTLADHSLIEYLADQLQLHPDVPARKLCLQVHENVLSEYPNQAQTFCEAMRTLGVRVAVDQFSGRSPSDVALIRRLHLDFVKIDALQFRSLSTDPVEQMLAESVIRLSRALRKRVVVGNIADAGALEAWRRLGADYLQGATVAKPSPVVFYAPGG